MRSRTITLTIFDNNPLMIDEAVEQTIEFVKDVISEHVEEVRIQEK